MGAKIAPSHLARLLDRQANLWEIRQRLAREGGEAARRELAHLAEGPWISISKQLGSGGVELAHCLAERLDCQVYDREILEQIEQQTHARNAILSRLDQREVSWLEDALARLLTPEGPVRMHYLHELMRVVWTLGRQGRAVILGRGANWLLDPAYGLRVRTIAPMSSRVARFAGQEEIDEGVAEARLRADDRERAGFVRQAFGRDIEDPMGYDLILNLGAISVETATDAVAAALHSKLDTSGARSDGPDR